MGTKAMIQKLSLLTSGIEELESESNENENKDPNPQKEQQVCSSYI